MAAAPPPPVEVAAENNNLFLDNLPEEIYHNCLFKLLDLDEVLELRLINKSFYYLVKTFKIKELSFLRGFHLEFNFKDKWFSTTGADIDSAKLRNELDDTKLDLLKNPRNNILNLRYLRFNISEYSSIKLEYVNKFRKLHILDITYVGEESSTEDLIQLPFLRALSIYVTDYVADFHNLTIDSPNLHSLRIINDGDLDLMDEKIHIIEPLCIQFLHYDDCDKIRFQFYNLKCLQLSKYGFNEFERDDLSTLPNLKTLKILPETNLSDDEVAELTDLFESNENDLVIVVDGVIIKEVSKFSEHQKKSKLEFQLHNYDSLEDDLYFVTNINYNELERLFPTNRPDDLFAKYNNIHAIQTKSAINDADLLTKFIKGCHNLNSLDIYTDRTEQQLQQQFYDGLPAVSSLSYLRVFEIGALRLNFEFIMKMPYLKCLATCKDVIISQSMNLNNLKYLKRIYAKHWQLTKDDKDKYLLKKTFEGRGPSLPYQNLYYELDEVIESTFNLRDVDDLNLEEEYV